MLQYPVQLPPLSINNSSARKNSLGIDSINDAIQQRSPLAMNNKQRIQAGSPRSPFATLLQLPNYSPTASPSPSSNKPLPRSPYISSSRLPPTTTTTASPLWSTQNSYEPSSLDSPVLEDVLAQGDIIGEGCTLQYEQVRLVPIHDAPSSQHFQSVEEPAKEFEVVRRLGTGSYAVVYLVREVLQRPQSSDGGHSVMGSMDLEGMPSRRSSFEYGREYAIKCLSKANLDQEALDAQMAEVNIHQSLKSHPNIVTLHRTLETSSFLLLLLEYVPGEDLFYFLEQARDHYDPSLPSPSESPSNARTPPTPSLLSTLNPGQLLSVTRLKLIASMFSQMCEAVAACHDQNVFHRDIKPENFIVTDGWTEVDGRRERKVIVKLTDFGLSTKDVESSDMDCGSAPYMSFECRNNIAPTYRPRAADVWSLGIVLINMLYHYNPWTDTTLGVCSSFDAYTRDPFGFFMQRFIGMTYPVADTLASKVFCILPTDTSDDSKRISARDFGLWVKDLPVILGDHSRDRDRSGSGRGHQRVVSTSSIGHPILAPAVGASHRPSSRNPSVCGTPILRTPALPTRSLSRAPSPGRLDMMELPTVFDREGDEEEGAADQPMYQVDLNDLDQDRYQDQERDQDHDQDQDESASRSHSTTKRRKRGARKGKGAAAASAASPIQSTMPMPETLDLLASASQSLAREVSKASRPTSSTRSSQRSSSRRIPYEPVSMYAMPVPLVKEVITPAPSPVPIVPTTSRPTVARKTSKWKLSFGKNSAGRVSPVDEVPPPLPQPVSSQAQESHGQGMSSAATSNVAKLIMGLNAPVPSSVLAAPHSARRTDEEDDHLSRGRKSRPPPLFQETANSNTWGPHSSTPSDYSSLTPHATSPHTSVERWGHPGDKRSDRSPASNRSGRPLASAASSTYSGSTGSWRNSTSTTSTTSSPGTSTSAFTRYSNGSLRSISTTATSVSASSWRTQPKGGSIGSVHSHSTSSSSNKVSAVPKMPPNIKMMDGVPYELNELPRGQYSNPNAVVLGSAPPPRKQRARKPKDPKLDTINERPIGGPAVGKSPLSERMDAAAMISTTDLASLDGGDGDGPKKVPKGQINALAKMLSALRR